MKRMGPNIAMMGSSTRTSKRNHQLETEMCTNFLNTSLLIFVNFFNKKAINKIIIISVVDKNKPIKFVFISK